MKTKPLVLTELALARILKEFAKRFGLDDSMADVVAQVHMQQSPSAGHWSDWLLNNCSDCAKDPETCEFFNPQRKNILGDAHPADVRSANCLMVETKRYARCPAKIPA